MKLLWLASFALFLAAPALAAAIPNQHVQLMQTDGLTQQGTASSPMRIDPTGTTTQPVSQSTAAVLSGAWPVKLTDGTDEAQITSIGQVQTYEAIDTALGYCKVTVGTTAVALRCGASNQANRRRILIFNNGSSAIFIGGNTSVTTGTGYPIPAPSGGLLSSTGYAPIQIDIGPDLTLYAISAAAGQDIRVIEGS